MTTKQRLLKRLGEIENELQDFTDEMAAISEQNLKKSDNEYNSWVHNKFFMDDLSYFNPVERSNLECINMLKQAVGYLTEKAETKVKVIMTVNNEWYAREVWVDKDVFERMQATNELVKCPQCGSWVLKDCTYDCICGHQFKVRKDILELTCGDVVERYIKTGPWTKEYELVIDGKTYPAEYKLVPKGQE